MSFQENSCAGKARKRENVVRSRVSTLGLNKVFGSSHRVLVVVHSKFDSMKMCSFIITKAQQSTTKKYDIPLETIQVGSGFSSHRVRVVGFLQLIRVRFKSGSVTENTYPHISKQWL